LSITEAAAWLGCCNRTIRNLVTAGQLEAFSVGNGTKRPVYRIAPSALHAYVKRATIKRAKKTKP